MPFPCKHSGFKFGSLISFPKMITITPLKAYLILSIWYFVMIWALLKGFQCWWSVSSFFPFWNIIINKWWLSLLLSFISRNKPISGSTIRYCLISFHFPNSESSFHGFEPQFKIMPSNSQNFNTCIWHDNIWNKRNDIYV